MELHIALIQYIMIYGENVLKFFSRITDVQLKTTCTYSVSSYSVHSSFTQIMVFGVMMGL